MLNAVSRGALYAALVWAPLASGAYRGWPLAILTLLVAVGLAGRLGGMLAERRLEWRRTPMDLPLALLVALVLVQLALGNGPLVRWALAPPPPAPELRAAFPAPLFGVGTVTPPQTLRSLLLFLLYAATYYLVVHHVKTRRQVTRLARTLLALGGLMAFLGLLDYLTGETWLLAWRDHPYGGRLSATFVNPDHFASWLAMLICLGVGWVVARGREGRGAPALAELLASRELREQVVRRYLPVVGLVTMAIAIVFTLSRGGVLSLGAALVAMLALLGATGRARRSLVVTGVLLVAVAGYGGWIGFEPFLARLAQSPEGALDRLGLYVSSLPMLRDFPVLGVGFGGYLELYPRYQPLRYRPHEVYFPYAHNDVLQLVLETGVVGAAIGLLFLWRVVADLGAAHLFGRGACPVDGGAGEGARRNDPLSVGIAIGALGGALAMLAHSTLDFGMRIPANGVLAAALLGLATVALHTRLVAGREQLLTAVRAVALSGRAWLAAGALAIAGLTGLAGWSAFAVRTALADAPRERLRERLSMEDAERLLALDPWSTPARRARALARQNAAWAVWTGRTPSASPDAARHAALGLLAEGRADLHAALRAAPTNPALHHHLAWIEAVDAVVRGRTGGEALTETLAHAARAVALAPENPRFYASTARLAMRELPQLGLRAAREATRRDPALIPALVDLYRQVGLSEAEWLALVPEAPVDRLDLAAHLEDRRLVAEALAAYRAALAGAGELERPLYRWMLAQALLKAGQAAAAQSQLEAALRSDARNPELHRALGTVRAARGDADALESFRLALAGALERARVRPTPPPFVVTDERLLGIAERRAGGDWTNPARYRRALALHLLVRKLWEQAAAEWQRLALDDPRAAEARFALGAALDGSGLAREALEHYRQAVALDPATPRYRERLAQRLWDSEQFFQAINEWRTVKSQAPKNLEARLALARAYERIGERGDAFREYREILELAPGHPGASQGLARLSGRRS